MDDPKRKFQGVWIPAAIWLDRSLSITEKVMLVEINSLESLGRGCFASNEHFSEFFDLSKSRVSEIISSLADKDLVRIDQIRKGKQVVERQIWMTETGRLLTGGTSSENTKNPLRKTRRTSSENTENSFGKYEEPPSENTKESNTDSNNTESNTHTDPEGAPPPDPSPAGLCCQKMRVRGIAQCNPSHPTLIALIDAGASESEFEQATIVAVDKGKPDFAYVIGIVKRQREQAAKLVIHKGRMPNKQEKFDPVAYVNRFAKKGSEYDETVIEHRPADER